MCWRAAWAPSSATTWSTPRSASSPSSRATSGTPSGTPATAPCRVLEIISPAGFEHYFDELAAGTVSPGDVQARYGTQVDLDRTRRICEQHGLVFPTTR